MIRKNWIYELDVLRFGAIIMVLLCHIRFFSPTAGIELLNKYEISLGNWGVMIFFFISGVLLIGSKCGTIQEVKIFIVKKAIRIFPLYWLSLATTFLVFGFFAFKVRGFQYDLSMQNFIIQGIGAQVFFPAYKIPAMWYIGAILLFYLIYAGLSYFAKDNLLKFSIGTLILFIGMNLLQIAGYLDGRATYFYFVFIAGVLTGKILLTSPPDSHTIPSWIVFASYAAFAVYLFQFQILAGWSVILSSINVPVTILTLICGFPLVFVMGYFIQYGYDTLIKNHTVRNKIQKSDKE
jgi:peptidoglycan/LPS O-acetylase OafA/YrhL